MASQTSLPSMTNILPSPVSFPRSINRPAKRRRLNSATDQARLTRESWERWDAVIIQHGVMANNPEVMDQLIKLGYSMDDHRGDAVVRAVFEKEQISLMEIRVLIKNGYIITHDHQLLLTMNTLYWQSLGDSNRNDDAHEFVQNYLRTH
jgi:ribulose bisphosphate carboxylase small subunit